MDQRPLLVAQLENRGMLARFVRVALLHEVARVPLDEAPRSTGPHTLQLRVGSSPGITLFAEPAGTGTRDAFPLRLMPLDPSHVPELHAIIKEEEPSLASLAPMSASASAIFDEFPPLMAAEHGAVPRSTVPDPESSTGRRAPPSSSDNDEEYGASVLFDPEAALISRSPPRPPQAGADDTLTVPFRASAFPNADPRHAPPQVPGGRSASQTALAKASPPSARPVAVPAPPPAPSPKPPSALPNLPDDPKITAVSRTDPSPLIASAEQPSAISAVSTTSPSRLAPTGVKPLAPGEGSVSITVDFNTNPQTSAAGTERNGQWSEAEAPDPSLSESVVIDPDILTRERTSARPQAPAHTIDDEFSVVFGDEATSPGSRPGAGMVGAGMVGVHVKPNPVPNVETTTQPGIGEPHIAEFEAATLIRDSRPPVESRAVSSSTRHGPRTVKRNHVDVAGRLIANKYRIQSLVGAGAVGAVYKAAHTELERTVAIKVLHPHYRADPHLMQSFRSEARAASLLHHPNVTVVHDFGEEPDGLVYIVMEYLQGWTLQTVLDEEKRLKTARAIGIMLQICAALSAAHERGIVHRDVKPDNIILIPTRDDEGRPFEMVKVCDFGIAALESMPEDDDDEYTAGTPEYMAPEQAAGRADARTDVYSCGILLYEMITGRPPFIGDGPVATLKRHATEAPKPPSELVEIPKSLESAILRAIEKAPEHRYPTMREMRAELKRQLV